MGLKDHLEDGTGHILSLELDLDYLHVEGAERQGSPSAAAGAGGVEVSQVGAEVLDSNSASFSTHSSFSASSSCSNLSEESAASDCEDERLRNGFVPGCQHPHPDHHLVRLDLTQPETSVQVDPVIDCRTKVEFALKLGYPEDLVLLVLRKLGTDALINDVLGELVKLGTKMETEQQGGPAASQSLSSSISAPSSSSSFRSSVDSCRLLCPSQQLEDKENLRPVVVDGSNVAMSHGNKEVFSCQGIQLAVDWFLDRGHRDITVFVPAWRKEQSRPDALITDQDILRRLERDKILVFTPSRRVQGRRVVCYDDRFIVKLAYESDGIIVSNDNYRDLANEKPEWKKFIDERLLMYSFVNDKFMPPDDPLGRHGPSLENFLRKRPVVHRKQPCPYGKKCTYGHKCKFYHPERSSQPQRAVADELRASAKISSAGSRVLLEDSLMTKSQSPGRGQGIADTELGQSTPKKQPSHSPRHSFSDLLEDRFRVQTKMEGRRGSSSSSGSSSTGSFSSSFLTPGVSSSTGSWDRWEYLGTNSAGRTAAASGSSQAETYHRCESPEIGLSSLMKTYSNLSLVVPQSPECFFPSDLRAGSLLSDCSSDSSLSSDSFSPDPLLDDCPKCHHHHHPHHHHHCSTQYTHSTSRVPPGLGQHAPHGYPIPLPLQRQSGFSLDDPSPSVTSDLSPFKSPSTHVSPHLRHSSLSSFHGDFPPRPPQTPPSQTSSHGCNLISSLWQEGRLQDSRAYQTLPPHSRRTYPGINQQPLPQINWESQYQQSPKTCYDLFGVHSRSRPAHSSVHSLAPSGLPPLQQLSLTSILPSVPQHPELPALGRYQDLRERTFVNLCGIFPPDLVRLVMTRNPHVMDAQELAAAILLEKSQLGS